MKKNLRKLISCAMLICLIFGLAAGVFEGKAKEIKAAVNFKIHYIDVGQADAALLQYGDGNSAKYALIDAGAATYHKSSDANYAAKEAPAYAYLKKKGVTRLEFILLTHPHKDHIGGMEKILEDETIEIGTIYGNDLKLEYWEGSDDKDKQETEPAEWTEFDSEVYKNFKEKLNERCELEGKDVEEFYQVPEAGSSVYLGSAKLTFYGPLANDYEYGRSVDLNTRQENKYSIVCKITYGKNSFLMTGDAQKETIEKIADQGYDLTAQVLKEPHHGFQDVTDAEREEGYPYSDHKYVIDKSKANIAIISNGYKNIAGDNGQSVPYSKVLKDLSKMDVYQTSDKGTIVVNSDGTYLSITTERGGKTPSHKGSQTTTTSPYMKQMSISSNNTKKLKPTLTSADNSYKIYERKNITVRFYGTANPFTKLTNVQYKFVKKGVDNRTVSYKTGTSYTVKNGNVGRIYVRYNTPFGTTDLKLPGFTVDTKAPSSVKIKANKSGIKTIKTSSKNTYKKRLRRCKSIKFTFPASYGTSGKLKTQYKIVPKGKANTKYKWKTGNSVTYKTRNKKVRLYVRWTDKSGNTTTRKTNGFYLTKY